MIFNSTIAGSGGGASGIIVNPLNGAEMYVENGSITYTYEFKPPYDEIDTVAFSSVLNLTGLDYLGRSLMSASVDFNQTGNVLTISNSLTNNIQGVCVVIFRFGPTPSSEHAIDWFRLCAYYDPCYLRGTLIMLADGSEKPVEDVTYDDELLVWDFDEGRLSTAKPLWVKCAQRKVGYYHLTLDGGRTLDVVGSNGKAHRLLDVDAEEFVWSTDMVGHRTMTIDGMDRLASCEPVDKPCEFYNIVTERHINLYANGILTSCRYNNIYPIRGMRFVKGQKDIIPFEAYDVPREWYDGMRLGEQTIPIEDTNKYVKWRVEHSI